ncbi:DUF4158 domain-containing protein [Plantibacter sp. RU18]|uniref:DUF4158 domain-containing protein n=1 Tax=Plantibacter sp. RU18 TaxID=3158143 RepID=UPI003D36ADDF
MTALTSKTEPATAGYTTLWGTTELLGNKSGTTRLGFALTLKFFELEGRFPRSSADLPSAAVAYVAGLVGVDAVALASYEWTDRTAKRHRAQIREVFGFREFSSADEERFARWLAERVCPSETRETVLREALLGRVRAERIEPPARVKRILGAARALFESSFCARVWERLGAGTRDRLEALIADGTGGGALAQLRADPGSLSLDSLLEEVDKLHLVHDLQLPSGVFVGGVGEGCRGVAVASGAVVSFGFVGVVGAGAGDPVGGVVSSAVG